MVIKDTIYTAFGGIVHSLHFVYICSVYWLSVADFLYILPNYVFLIIIIGVVCLLTK